MKKTFTLKELLSVSPALGALGNAPFKNNFKLSRRIAKVLKTADAEIKEFNETREKMLRDKYAESDEHGKPVVVDNNYKVRKELAGEFTEELDKLQAETVALTFDPITWDEIEAALKEPLSPAVIADLEWLFV
jgi:hypothetical protein